MGKRILFQILLLFSPFLAIGQTIISCPTNSISNVQVNYSGCSANATSVSVTVANTASILSLSIDGGITTQTSSVFNNVAPGNYVLELTDLTNCTSTYAFTVLNPAIPQFTSFSVVDANCIGNSGVINFDVSGGLGIYSYYITYSNGQTYPLPSDSVGGFVSGTYAITVEDANGCENDTAVTVQFYGFPVIGQVNVTNPGCNLNNGTIEITILNPPPVNSSFVTLYSINYGQNYQTTNIFTNLAPGTYYIYVAVSGCLSNNGQPVVVTIAPQSNLNFASVAITSPDCGANNGSILIQTQPPSSNALFGINSGPTSNNLGSFGNLGAGSYLLTVVDSIGCVIDTLVTLIEESGPSFAGINVSLPSCGGSDGSIQILTNQTGTNNLLFSIDNGVIFQNDSLFSNLSSGVYTITIQQNLNCMVDSTVLVNDQPGPSILSLNALPPQCGIANGEISIVSSFLPVQFSIDGGLNFQTSGFFTNLPSGFYTVTIQSNPGCLADTLIFFPDNSIPFIDAGIDTSICSNELLSLTANASNGAFITWDNGIVNGIPFTANLTETYLATATLSNGCSSQDTVTVTVLSPIQPIISTQTLVPCLPASVLFSVENDVYSSSVWTVSNGDVETSGMNASFTFDLAGCYSLNFSALDVNSCPVVVNLLNPICFNSNPIADFIASPGEVSTQNTTVELVNLSLYAQNFTWIFPDSNLSSVVNPMYSFPEMAGIYDVILIASDSNGCADTIREGIRVKEQNYLYVPNAFTPNGDEANQLFKPVFSEYSEKYTYLFRIYNRLGELIFESKNPEIGWDGTFRGQLVKTEIYSYEIQVRLQEDTETTFFSGHVNVLR